MRLLILRLPIILSVALVLGIADSITTQGTKPRTDSGTFEATATLMTDDTAQSSTADSTNDSASLSIWTSSTGGKATSHDDREKDLFHGMETDNVCLRFIHNFCENDSRFSPFPKSTDEEKEFQKSQNQPCVPHPLW